MKKLEIIACLIESADKFDEIERPDEANILTKIAQTLSNPDDFGSDQIDGDSNRFLDEAQTLDYEAEFQNILRSLAESGEPIDPTMFDAFKSVLGEQYINDEIQQASFANELQNSGATIQ